MVESPPTSKLRSTASQLCAAFPYICLIMSFGSSAGFQIIFIAELYKDNSEIASTVDQLSWFVGLDILNIVGLTIGGVLTQYFGTRATAVFTSLMYIVSWLLYYYSTNISMVLIARAISASTSTLALAIPYISEISEPHLRGIFLGVAQLTIVISIFIALVFGTFMYWRTIALISLTMPVVTAVTVLTAPNSPIWLVNKERFEEAEKALCWLRGWVQPEQVKIELQALMESARKSKSNADKKSISPRGFYKLLLQRSFYIPLGILCLFSLVYVLSGGPIMDSFATVMFREINSPIDESLATAIMSAMSIAGKVIIISFLQLFGKRKFILTATVVVFSCQALISTIGLLKLQAGLYSWIPSMALIFSNLANVLGAGSILYMIVSEIFPSSVRYIGSSISFAFYSIVESTGKKMFLYVLEAVSLPVVFALFAVGNAIAFVTYYFLMPETEGKSLQEVEDHFNRVQVEERSNKSTV